MDLQAAFINTMMQSEACYLDEVLVSYPRTRVTVENPDDLAALAPEADVFDMDDIVGMTGKFSCSIKKRHMDSIEFMDDTKQYVIKTDNEEFAFMFLELKVIHHNLSL